MTDRKLRERAPRTAPPAKQSNNRVDKRPARGYHTFKNGALNVTPKGAEKDIVESNQDSPLLRLPAEIRNSIWKYAVGGKTIRQVIRTWRKANFLPEPGDRINTFALLSTCRQIFAESAHLPFAGNTFSIEYLNRIGKSFKAFRKHQLNQIKEVSIEISTDEIGDNTMFTWFQYCFQSANFDILPNLRRLRFCLFPSQRTNHSLQKFEKLLLDLIEREPESKQYELVVQRMDMYANDFRSSWQSASNDD